MTNKLSQIVFMEVSEIRRLTGEIIGSEENMLLIKTSTKLFKINKNMIIKIEEQLEGSEFDG